MNRFTPSSVDALSRISALLSTLCLSFAVPALAAAEEEPASPEPEVQQAEPLPQQTQRAPAEADWYPAREQATVPRDRRGRERLTFPAEPDLAAPEGYELAFRPLKGLIYGGVGALGGGYAMSLVVSGFDYLGSHGEGPTPMLYIPVAGPVIAAALDPDSLATGFYVASGIIQNAGLAMMIIGATIERPVFTAIDIGAQPVNIGFGPGTITFSGEF